MTLFPPESCAFGRGWKRPLRGVTCAGASAPVPARKGTTAQRTHQKSARALPAHVSHEVGVSKSERKRSFRSGQRLCVVRHLHDLVAGHRPDHVGMVGLNMRLDVGHEIVVGLPAHRHAAGTVNCFSHDPPFGSAEVYAAETSTPSLRRASLAASCSAAFFDSPLPTPSCSPSLTAAEVKRRSCGGPSTSSTE